MLPTHEQWLDALRHIVNERCTVRISRGKYVEYSDPRPYAAAVGYAEAVEEHMTDREAGAYEGVVVAGNIIVWPEDRLGEVV